MNLSDLSNLSIKNKPFIKRSLISFLTAIGLCKGDKRILLISIKASDVSLILHEKGRYRNTEMVDVKQRRAVLPKDLQENEWRMKASETAAFIKDVFMGKIVCENINEEESKGKSWQLPDKIVFLLAEEQYFVKRLELPHMPKKELCYAALWEADSYVPYEQGKYYAVADCPAVDKGAEGDFGNGIGAAEFGTGMDEDFGNGSGAAEFGNGMDEEFGNGSGAADGAEGDLSAAYDMFDEVFLYAAEKDLVDALADVGKYLPVAVVAVVPGEEIHVAQSEFSWARNFLPEERRDRKNLRSYIYGAALVLCIICSLLMLAAGALFSLRDGAALANFKEKAERQAKWKLRYNETGELERKTAFCKEKYDALGEGRINYGDFLYVLAASMPYSCSLDSVFVQDGKTDITGEALDVAAVAEFSNNLRRKIPGAESRIAFTRKNDRREDGLIKFGVCLKFPASILKVRGGEKDE